jgi:hypothetical protein
MAGLIYILCAITAFACAWLLFRAYSKSGHLLLLWSSVCFAFLTLGNVMLVADRLILPDLDLSTWRLLPALAAISVMIYGLIFHGE